MTAAAKPGIRILGITPARGGSKGIPRKNIRDLCGKPLIAWTIEAALQSRLLSEYVVSTDDEEIAQVSRSCGADVIIRPPELASDEATTLSVLQHVLENNIADIVVLLQCTSPVRRDGLIDMCIETYLEKNANTLATGIYCEMYEWGKYPASRRQDMGYFHDDGNVYVIAADLIRQGQMRGERCERFISLREESFEIDDELDFWINEMIIERGLYE